MMDDLLAEFLTETNESLAGLDEALLTLERSPGDRATVGLIFRLVHTIKGTCGFLGLPRLERVAHAAENVLGLVRDGSMAATPELVTAVLGAVDAMKAIVSCLSRTGEEPAGDDSVVVARLDAIVHGEDAPVAAAAAESDEAEAPAPLEPGVEEAVAAPEQVRPEPEGSIRVSVGVLENLMTLVSELVLTRNQLLQISRSARETVFTAPVQRLSQITTDLQEGVMKTRMQPIGSAWNKLPRLVRDLSQELRKPIQLRMVGAETEIDRQVLELVRDPLTHMVRNSADHGLEGPEQRLEAGKPEVGTITLSAYHEGGQITIGIADDGRGLAVDRIRAKALSQGLATEAELAAMPAAAVQRFIFNAGFSTATEVTSVSGRGVGMDVVRSNIERIGGTIELDSQPGKGTCFTIRIPLTLAIVSALIVEAAGERFAIAQSNVAELVQAEQAESGTVAAPGQAVIERIDDTRILRLRGRLLPLVTLSELLHLPDTASLDGRKSAHVVVLSVGSGSFGIVVDRVFDTEEIVVKPVSPVLRDITLFSGNTVLGDGAVIMILDPAGIARAANVSVEGGARTIDAAVVAGTRSEDETAVLLFRAGSATPKAVPLGLVARLERFPAERIEEAAGRLVTQYCGRLVPLVPMSPMFDRGAQAEHPVLVFTENERSVGLLVDEIVDVVHDRMVVEMAEAGPGLLGTALIAGIATELVDTAYWLSLAGEDWFKPRLVHAAEQPRLLVIEDSSFFRNMLIPALSSGGFHVTAVNEAAEALSLRAAGTMFDAIISDIEMPGMDGLDFARSARAEGIWRDLPLIALSGRVTPPDVEAGLAAGFSHYMAKFDREALLDRLRRCLAQDMKEAA